MKKIFKFFTVAVVMLSFSLAGYSQATATGNAAARILSPITLTAGADLNFATIYKSVGGGTVRVTPAGVRTVVAGTVTLAAAPVATAGTFTVGGDPALTYTITLPADGVVTISNGAVTMPVNVFTVTSASGTNTLSGAGSDLISIGADLIVGGGQASGTYTGTYNVTVQYN
jgi:predicted small secreted protein